MVWWFGGKSSYLWIALAPIYTDWVHRISKLMGESFKLHSQALVGYEDEIMPDPSDEMAPLPDQGLMPLETAY